MKYEPVIGIECHVQLKTNSKLFCACDNDARDKAPNTTVCPVCMGFPGTLPVLNEQAVKLAIRAGLALNAKIPTKTKFDRKNYFYPDLPHGYQITQFDQPIVGKGEVEVFLGDETFKVGITRAHMEADAGKLTHPDGADYSLVDYNRAGTPLLEIVSEPDIRSGSQAKAYAQELYNLMRYADVSDANLYYGNMRFDVNVSLRPVGQTEFGTRSETKNLNSFRAVERAVDFEIERQTKLLEAGETIVQETRGWDDAKQITFSQRSKEEAMDYRYFPEPDIPPLVITEAMIKEAKNMVQMLPKDIRDLLAKDQIDSEIRETITNNPELARKYSDASEQKGNMKRIANLLVETVKMEEDNPDLKIAVSDIIQVTEMIKAGQLSSTAAKEVLRNKTEGKSPQQTASELNLIQVSDSSELEKIVDQIIADNPRMVQDFQSGKTQVIGALVGQVMKQSRGQANPPVVNKLLLEKLTLKNGE